MLFWGAVVMAVVNIIFAVGGENTYMVAFNGFSAGLATSVAVNEYLQFHSKFH